MVRVLPRWIATSIATVPGWSPGALTDSADLRARYAPPPEQLSLF